MPYLGDTLKQVFTRTCGADVSLRDVTIAQDGKTGLQSAGDLTHRKSVEDFGNLKKESWELDTERDGGLSLARGGLGPVSHEMVGAEEKASIKILCLSLSLCRRTFTLKGNKKFRTWTMKSCFSCFEIPMLYLYGHSMYVSRSCIWPWYTRLVAITRLKNQSALLFTHSWREKNWIHNFPNDILLYEIQSPSSRIWTRVAVFISDDDNYFPTGSPY